MAAAATYGGSQCGSSSVASVGSWPKPHPTTAAAATTIAIAAPGAAAATTATAAAAATAAWLGRSMAWHDITVMWWWG